MTDEETREFVKQALQEMPELHSLIDLAKQEQWKPERVYQHLQEIFSKLQEHPPLNLEPELEDSSIMQKERGLDRLNPLLEAGLIERAQFDGDIPELRTGPAPIGVSPAVSVETSSTNPTLIGMMLCEASERIKQDLLLLENPEEEISKEVALMILAGEEGRPDPPSYKRGELAKVSDIKTPSGSSLLHLTPKERKAMSWGFISTTQGRRSAVDTIERLLKSFMRRHDMNPQKIQGPTQTVYETEWSMTLSSAENTQENFDVIRSASYTLARKALDFLRTHSGEFDIEILSLNAYRDRLVGWVCRVKVPRHLQIETAF